VQANTVWGVFGIFDVASDLNIERHREDFGQTLGKWGVHSGPYVMLPFLGPSTVRDSVGLLADEYTTPRAFISDPYIRWPIFTVDLIDHRAGLLDQDKYIDQSFDPYAFIRNVWLQRREYQIHGDQTQTPEEMFPDDASDAAGNPTPAAAAPATPATSAKP